VTVTAPVDRIVLSNMPEISSRPNSQDPALKTVYFDRTPIMSTYLVAIVVGRTSIIFLSDVSSLSPGYFSF
jgi:aminopeptidase N